MRTTCTLTGLALLALSSTAVADTVSLDPRGTYLHAESSDFVVDPAIVSLLDMGAPAGSTLRIQCTGDFVGTSGGPDNVTKMIAVFSSSDTLLGKSEAHRVPDAIDAGTDYATGDTWPAGEPTDIAEDFYGLDVTLEVPAGATHLFLCVPDNHYIDNGDPDGDLAAELTIITAPYATWPLMATDTFLRIDTGFDSAGDASPMDLATLGIPAGSSLRLRTHGDAVGTSGGTDTNTNMIAVFSASDELLSQDILDRVQDAIDAGTDTVSPDTWPNNIQVDVPEDFSAADVDIDVPTGATHLFVSKPDNYYADNGDPDGDFGVQMMIEPGVVPWVDYGMRKAGSEGEAFLIAEGALTSGSAGALRLRRAKKNSFASLVVGFTYLGAGFKGGVLGPNPDLIISGLPTGSGGSFDLVFAWPAGIPGGFATYYQYWVTDAGASHGLSSTNTVRGVTP